MYFAEKGKVDYSSCDAARRMRLPEAIRAMQGIATNHLDSLQLPYKKLYDKYNMVFLLVKNVFLIHRMPIGGEEYLLKTSPNHPKGAKFIRDVVIYDLEETPLLSFMSTWVLVDTESRKILRPSAYPYEIPYKDSLVSDYLKDKAYPKVEEDRKATKENTLTVVYTHIDNNAHVNNSAYMGFCLNMMEYDKLVNEGIASGMITYQNEAKHGDTIHIKMYVLEDSHYFTGNIGGRPCFSAQLFLND